MRLLRRVEGAQGIVAGDADCPDPQWLPDATAGSLVSLAKPAKVGKAVCQRAASADLQVQFSTVRLGCWKDSQGCSHLCEETASWL